MSRRTRHRKHRSRIHRQAPRTAKQYFAMSAQHQQRWIQVAEVISKMRANGVSLQQASRESGIDPRTVVRLGGSALRKGENGRYKAKASDRLLRVLILPSGDGQHEVVTRDSRQASQLAEYANGVHRYLETGDSTALRTFEGQQVTDANGKAVFLLTNLSELDRLGSAGVLSFESLYAKAG